MYYNMYYLMFMLPGLLISLWASFKMKSTFAKYEKVSTIQGVTGAQAARRILDGHGLHGVKVEMVAGNLSDHFDPATNVVNLSSTTYGQATIGAVGVAAHECGHAVQHAEGYAPAKLRMAIVPITNIGTSISIPLIILGMVLNVVELSYVGVALFSLAVVFQLVTLPVELNASKRALETLDSTGMVTFEEKEGVRKVLTAAALTYVAALLTSLLQLLYYISLAGNRRKR